VADRTLGLTDENILAWKIAVVPYGSEGEKPHNVQDCPYFLEHGTPSSCVTGGGGGMCGGFMGGTPGYVFCIWGLVYWYRLYHRSCVPAVGPRRY
jgi:hypothetical protein